MDPELTPQCRLWPEGGGKAQQMDPCRRDHVPSEHSARPNLI